MASDNSGFYQKTSKSIKITTLVSLFFLVFLCHVNALESKTLILKGDFNYPPYEYLNDQNEPDGFNVDIIRAVAAEMKLDIHIELDFWSKVRRELENGEIDALMGMFKTPERDKVFDFSVPHFIASYSVFTPAGSDISSLDEMRGKSVLIQRGDLAHDYMIENRLTERLLLRETVEDVLVDLARGEGDFAVVSKLQGMIILKENKLDNIEAVGPPIIQMKYCVAVRGGDAELLSTLNEGLSIIKTTGVYNEIYDKWFGVYDEERISDLRAVKYLLIVLSSLLVIMFIVFVWSWTLKRKVTERTKELYISEKKLIKARNYISNIINSMPSILVGIDVDLQVTHWNKAAEDATGIRRDEALGHFLTEVFPDLEEEVENVRESIYHNRINHHSRKLKHLEHGARYETITIFPLRDVEIKGAVIRIDDETDIVRMEEIMIQNEKMLSVGGLAAGMAHEINNPLAGIIQTSGVMSNRLGKHKDSPANIKAAEESGVSVDGIEAYMENRDIHRMINSIIDSGKRIARIIDNMLSFSRMEEGHFTLYDINDLMDKTLELASSDFSLKRNYDFKKINIQKDYQEDLPLVSCDGSKIQQVFLNLLNNAAQAMHFARIENPLIHIATTINREDQSVRVEIRDNGPGMNKDTVKRVFEPFFTTKPVGVGTGLGLSVSYFIVTRNHGGVILVDSSPGKGTAFSVELPLAVCPV